MWQGEKLLSFQPVGYLQIKISITQGNFHESLSNFCKVKVHTVWTGNVVPAEIVRRPSGDPPETLRRPSGDPPKTPLGGSPDFLAKSLVIPAIFTKFKLKFVSDKLEFCIYGWNYQ